MVPVAGVAFAQDVDEETATTTAAARKAASDIDTVTVVGLRIKRAKVEGPAPVTIITRVDIEREGFQRVDHMLQTITQNTSASGDLAVTGFTPIAQVVNLRNLGPGCTLTLIDRRRPAQYQQPYNRDNNLVMSAPFRRRSSSASRS